MSYTLQNYESSWILSTWYEASDTSEML